MVTIWNYKELTIIIISIRSFALTKHGITSRKVLGQLSGKTIEHWSDGQVVRIHPQLNFHLV